jgi:hypothetical protein
MKRLLFFLLLPVLAPAQVEQWPPNPVGFRAYPGETQVNVVPPSKKTEAAKYDLSRIILPASLAFVAGASWGIHETCVNWPDRIPPSWNEHFWDNRVSWENKWKRGEDGQLIQPLTPRFWGSSTFLVATTDAKHLFASVHRWGMLGTGISIGIGQKRPWWHYAADVGISALAYVIGFQTAVFAFKL